MFVVAPASRTFTPEGPTNEKTWPIVFESDEGLNFVVAKRDTREASQAVADALNKALS